MGVGGYYDPSKSQAANYAAEQAAVKHADTASQANAAMTSMTIKLSNLPQVAQQFAQGVSADLASQQMAKAAQDAVNIKGGINVKVNAADIVSQLKAAGVQGASALKSSLNAILSQAGLSKAQILKIDADVAPARGKSTASSPSPSSSRSRAGRRSRPGSDRRQCTARPSRSPSPRGRPPDRGGHRSPGGVPYTSAGAVANSPALAVRSCSGTPPGHSSREPAAGIMFPRSWNLVRRSSRSTSSR